LHVVEDFETALEYAVGEVKQIDCEYGGGYLKVDGEDVFDYGNGEIYVGGNKNSGIPLEELVPEKIERIKTVLAKIGL
jgi:hypothetical protein